MDHRPLVFGLVSVFDECVFNRIHTSAREFRGPGSLDARRKAAHKHIDAEPLLRPQDMHLLLTSRSKCERDSAITHPRPPGASSHG